LIQYLEQNDFTAFAMRKKFRIYAAIALISITAVAGFSFRDDYFEISKNLDIFATMFREVNLYYVDEIKPTDLMKTGIDAMLESLDPYTNYIPEDDIEDARFMTTGQYGGIGALIRTKDDYVVIADIWRHTGTNHSSIEDDIVLVQDDFGR
jgi:carboxyl-terminal processing protease